MAGGPTTDELLGLASCLCWVGVQAPQVVKNWQRGSVDGLSLAFLSLWLAGDLTSLIGCILLRQLAFQYVLAVWFIAMDLVLLVQFAWYGRLRPGRPAPPLVSGSARQASRRIMHPSRRQLSRSTSALPPLGGSASYADDADARPGPRGRPAARHSVSITTDPRPSPSVDRARRSLRASSVALFGLFGLWTLSSDVAPISHTGTALALPAVSPQLLIRSEGGANGRLIAGRMSAWLAAALYLASRGPQIWTNWLRGSVAGLSMGLFGMAFAGNVLYTASIMVHGDSSGEALPFLIGSAGTLCFDITIILQSRIYARSIDGAGRDLDATERLLANNHGARESPLVSA